MCYKYITTRDHTPLQLTEQDWVPILFCATVQLSNITYDSEHDLYVFYWGTSSALLPPSPLKISTEFNSWDWLKKPCSHLYMDPASQSTMDIQKDHLKLLNQCGCASILCMGYHP